ncbi:adenosylcobinamide-GDP ribazoletransferase [Xylophilus sp. GW821-FHT01B05]
MQQHLRHFLLALQFFTRIPVTGRLADWVGFSPQMLRDSAAHLPGVGWVVGLAACVVYALAAWALGPTPFTPLAAAILCTIATVLLTGGFHEDGLADTADGLGGSADRERALEIMKDSRLGAFGALALVLALAAKVALLAVLGTHGLGAVMAALFAAHVLSRFWPLLLMRSLPYVGATLTSKSKPLTGAMDGGAVRIALFWCFMPLALAALGHGAIFLIVSVAASAIALLLVGRLLARRLGGFTGDGLGAAQQCCEIAFYFGAAAVLG